MTTNDTQVKNVTPYAAAKIVNAVLNERGIDKVLPAQMLYNYTTAKVRAGKKPLGGLELDSDGKITIKSLTAWIERYVAKQLAS